MHSTKRIVRDPDVKKLYNSQRWVAMRANQLAREPWCVVCMKISEHVFATEVDHIRPHHGDATIFFDEMNLQSLCKPHHSAKTAKEVLHHD